MEFPRFELMTAQVAYGLEPRIKRGLSRSLANLVPWRTRVKHLDGGVSRFLRRLDLFGVFVAVPDFKGQGVVADVSFDVNAKINLHEVALLEHTLTVPTFNGCNGVIGGEVSRQIVHSDGPWKRRFSSVSVNKSLC